MKSTDFVAKLKKIATDYKTLYVLGCFGAPMTAANKKRYTSNYAYNRDRAAMINAASADTFGFDCVCLIKGVLWGWKGDKNAEYGGAKYNSNGVPDISEDAMINLCSGVSYDFTNVEPGEAVWMPGHIGVYIGDGLAVECTPKWKNKVQITACNCDKSGYNRRNWSKHGKLPYITYVKPGDVNGDGAVNARDVVELMTQIATGKAAKNPNADVNGDGAVNARDVVALMNDIVGASTKFAVGDKVRVRSGVTTFADGTPMALWVRSAVLYVRKIEGDKLTVSTQKTGAVTGIVKTADAVKA